MEYGVATETYQGEFRRVWRRGRRCQPIICPANFPEALAGLGPSWLRDACATWKDLESDQTWAGQDDCPETTQKLTPLPAHYYKT